MILSDWQTVIKNKNNKEQSTVIQQLQVMNFVTTSLKKIGPRHSHVDLRRSSAPASCNIADDRVYIRWDHDDGSFMYNDIHQ